MARPKNSNKSIEKYREQYREDIALILNGYSTNTIHTKTNTSISTIKRLKKMIKEDKL
jgi:transposase